MFSHPVVLRIGFLIAFLGMWPPSEADASNLPECWGNYWDDCQGTRSWPNAGEYVGEFNDNEMNGQGTFTWVDGDKYVGEFKANQYNGQGTLTFDGNKYVGGWKDDKRNGQGTATSANGDKVVGKFKGDKLNGQGTLTFADGRKYVGEFKDNKYDGQGTFTTANGDKYVGGYKDNKRHGHGTFTYADGRKYVGEFKDDKLNGRGTYTWADGIYVGDFKDNQFDGQGTVTFVDGYLKGHKQFGQFKDGKPNGQGTAIFPNGNKYVGELKDSQSYGLGTYTFASGDKYVGEFKDWELNGASTASYANGDTFSGNYTSNKRQGQGTYIWKDGSKYIGQWADGVPTEDGLHTSANGTVLREVKYKNSTPIDIGGPSGNPGTADVLTYEAPAVVAPQTVQQTVQVVQPISPVNADTGKRVALVIGNGKYVNSGYLPNPSNDARSIASALTEIGFDVSKGEDLDRAGMEQLLREFLRKAASSKVALFFFAGHGMQVNGKNYLIPVDAKLEAASDLNFGTVELDKILASLDDPTRATIIILDACRDNPLARTFASTSRSGAVGNGLAGYSALGSGTLIAFSTAPGQVALDGEGSSNSPFTQGLVKHLGTPGLEVRHMLTRVRADVATATQDKQIPWDNSSLRGDVYLAGSPPESNVTTQTQPSQIAIDPAAQAWGIIQNTTSVAVLEDFVRQFSTTVYGSLAKARLEELKKSQASNGG